MHYGASSVAAGQIQRFFFGQGRKYGEGGKIVSCLAREPRLRGPTKKVRPFPYFRQCPKNPSFDHDSARGGSSSATLDWLVAHWGSMEDARSALGHAPGRI